MSITAAQIQQSIRKRGFICLTDDIGRGGNSILVAPALDITTDVVNELLTLSHGVLFVALSPQRVRDFLLEPVRRDPGAPQSARFDTLVSVEAREGVTTGISASDRAATIRVLGEREPRPRQLVRPGHIFPVATREGGILIRPTLPEATIDLMRIGESTDAALFADVLDDAGEPIGAEVISQWCSAHSILHMTLSELIQFRLANEQIVTRVAEAKLPTSAGPSMRSVVYRTSFSAGEHVAVICGDLTTDEPVLTRVQAEFTYSDVFGGNAPPSKRLLQGALNIIGQRGRGVVVYLRRNDMGQLREQISNAEQSSQTKPASLMREYGVGAQVLRDLGVRRIELLTNTPTKIVGLDTFGIEIVRTVPIPEA